MGRRENETDAGARMDAYPFAVVTMRVIGFFLSWFLFCPVNKLSQRAVAALAQN